MYLGLFCKLLNPQQATSDTPQLGLVLYIACEAAVSSWSAVLQVHLLGGGEVWVQSSMDQSVATLLGCLHQQPGYQGEYLHPGNICVEVSVDHPWVETEH